MCGRITVGYNTMDRNIQAIARDEIKQITAQMDSDLSSQASLNQHNKQNDQINKLLKIKSNAIKLFNRGQYVDSLGELEKAIQLSPSDLELLFYEALCLYHLGSIDRAALIIEQLYEMDNDGILNSLPKVCSLILLKSGKYRKARNLINRHLESEPNDVQFLNMLGYSYEKEKKLEDAEKVYKIVLSQDKENANACNALAYIYSSHMNKALEANKLIDTALKQYPHNPAYLDTMGMIYALRGDYKNSMDKLKEALKQSPGNSEILSHINKVLKLNENKS